MFINDVVTRNKFELACDLALKYSGETSEMNSSYMVFKFSCIDTKQGFVEEIRKRMDHLVKVTKMGRNTVQVLA